MKSNKIMLVLLLVIAMSFSAHAGDYLPGGSEFISVDLINTDPNPAYAGNIVEVRVSVENTDSKPTENMILEFEEEYPFTIVPGEDPVKRVGTLDAYQTGDNVKIIKYRIQVDKNAPAGTYDLMFWQYKDGMKGLVGLTKTVSIDIKSKDNAEVIYIDKTSLVPGKQTSLQFKINNVGSAPLRDLTFSWENEDGVILPVGSDNTKYVKYIEIGDSAELQYQVIADSNADAGLYKLSLSLTYEDSITGEDKQISTVAGVYVGGGTDFDVAFSESSDGETAFSIANVGSNPANSVSVIIPKQDNWRVSGSSSAIIGNLNKGDYTVASFTLQSSMGGFTQQQDRTEMTQEEMMQLREQRMSQMSNTILIQIDYTDTMGERQSIEKQVSINPTALSSSGVTAAATAGGFSRFGRTQQQSFFSQYKWYIIGIAAVVVLLFLRGKYKRKKLEDPKFSLTGFFKRKK